MNDAKFSILFLIGKFIVACYAILVLIFSNDTKLSVHKIFHIVMANIYCQKYCWCALYPTIQFAKSIFHWELYTGNLKCN